MDGKLPYAVALLTLALVLGVLAALARLRDGENGNDPDRQ